MAPRDVGGDRQTVGARMTDGLRAVGQRAEVRRASAWVRTIPAPRPTFRGWAILAVGIGLVGGGLVAATSIAVSAGILLIAVDLMGAVLAIVDAMPLSGARRTGRGVVQAGEVVRMRLEVRGREVGSGTRLLVRERLDDHFARIADTEAIVTVGAGASSSWLDVEAIATRRGRPRVGPATVIVDDPFGTMRVDRVIAGQEEIVIVPRSTVLTGIDTGALAGAVSAEEGRTGQGGSADDSELRGYRPGDPIRRVHWGQSAKRGALHVRQTTQAQPPEATVVLDVQRDVYQRLGREPIVELADMGGDAAFEHAVEVAASVARILAARTSRVSLVTASASAPVAAGDLQDVLVGLADVAIRSDVRSLDALLPEVRQRDPHALTAVVTGACTAARAAAIVGHTGGRTRGLFCTIVPPDAATRGVLDRAGWRILVVPVGGGVHD